jgi:hypothetical protein
LGQRPNFGFYFFSHLAKYNEKITFFLLVFESKIKKQEIKVGGQYYPPTFVQTKVRNFRRKLRVLFLKIIIFSNIICQGIGLGVS